MKPKKNFSLFEHKKKIDNKIKLSYAGPFDGKVLAVLGDYISKVFNNDSVTGQKLFKIFIELAQNISFYSDEKGLTDPTAGVGSIIIRDEGDKLCFHTGNVIVKKNAEKIVEKCEIINNLDRQGLREFKRKQRNLPTGDKGTANIGLIQVALTSENPLQFITTSVDEEHCFFSIMVTVNKQPQTTEGAKVFSKNESLMLFH